MINLIRNISNKIKKTGIPVKHLIKFSIVGTSGILVNMSIFFILNEIINISYKISSIVSIETSIISNFLFNYFWTWKEKKEGSFLQKLFNFHIIAFLAGIINYLTLVFLVSKLDFNKYLANMVGIGLGFLINFSLNHFWNFKR